MNTAAVSLLPVPGGPHQTVRREVTAWAMAVRCRSVESSRDPGDVLQDVEPVDDAVASAAYRRQVLPLLLRQALDRLENE